MKQKETELPHLRPLVLLVKELLRQNALNIPYHGKATLRHD